MLTGDYGNGTCPECHGQEVMAVSFDPIAQEVECRCGDCGGEWFVEAEHADEQQVAA